MAKKNDQFVLWVILAAIVGFGWLFTQPADVVQDENLPACNAVEPDALFVAERMFVKGTAITDAGIRVFKLNSDVKDLGLKTSNSGTLTTVPYAKYTLMYGENSTVYYTQVVPYTAPCQDAQDVKSGILCTIDTNPTVTVKDENDALQSSSANAQAVGVSDQKDITIKVKAAADKCYGNPSAEGDNAICFVYNNTVFTSIKTDTGSQSLPYAVTAYAAAGTSIDCYKLNKLADRGEHIMGATLKSSATQPTLAHNVSIYLDDVAFDLHGEDLTEIWGFEDEDNNALGSAIVTGDTIYVS